MPEDRSILTRAVGAADRVQAYGPAPHQVVELRFAADGGARERSAGGTAQARPLVLLVHGGFWRPEYDRAHLRPLAEALAAGGWTTALIEYARDPGRPDQTVGDIELALRRVPALANGHGGRVIAVGHSAGGQLVLWAAADRALTAPATGPGPASATSRVPSTDGHPTPSAVLALGAVADLGLADRLNLDEGAVRAFIGADPATRPDLDPRRLPPQVPVTLIHGSDDAIVPPTLSESYADAYPGVRLVSVEGAGHYALIDPAHRSFAALLAELKRLAV